MSRVLESVGVVKLTELILELHTIMLEKGNLTVYFDSEYGAEEPYVCVVEGGNERSPYPGVHLSY